MSQHDPRLLIVQTLAVLGLAATVVRWDLQTARYYPYAMPHGNVPSAIFDLSLGTLTLHSVQTDDKSGDGAAHSQEVQSKALVRVCSALAAQGISVRCTGYRTLWDFLDDLYVTGRMRELMEAQRAFVASDDFALSVSQNHWCSYVADRELRELSARIRRGAYGLARAQVDRLLNVLSGVDPEPSAAYEQPCLVLVIDIALRLSALLDDPPCLLASGSLAAKLIETAIYSNSEVAPGDIEQMISSPRRCMSGWGHYLQGRNRLDSEDPLRALFEFQNAEKQFTSNRAKDLARLAQARCLYWTSIRGTNGGSDIVAQLSALHSATVSKNLKSDIRFYIEHLEAPKSTDK